MGTVGTVSDVVPAPDPWQMRASDSDREAYVAILQEAFLEGRLTKPEYDERMAAAYQATTYADLAPLLRDLPVPADRFPGPPTVGVPARRAASDIVVPIPGTSPLVAVFSEVKRENRWALADGQPAVAVLGALKLDLRQVVLQQPHQELKANAVFGSVEIIVPADIDVDVRGTGIFGTYQRTDQQSGLAPQNAGSRPMLTITGAAVFGSVEVKIVDIPVVGLDRIEGGPKGPPPAITP